MAHLLSSDIGRGHPYYLDGVREELAARGASEAIEADATVFQVASPTGRAAWHAAKRAYLLAGRGGPISRIYGAVRRGSPREGRLGPRVLGGGIVSWAKGARVVLVDHPVLVAALAGHAACWYQHGELVAPAASIVPRAARVFVPTREVADAFVRGGTPSARVVVTGLCVDAPFATGAREAARRRTARLAGRAPLTFALFSSGAEPSSHVATLVEAACGATRAGHTAVAFARRGGALARALERRRATMRGPGIVETVLFEGRADLDLATRGRFARFDVYVGPAHERSSWALGLGMPALLVGPDIGPFAPENRALLERVGVGRVLSQRDAARLDEDLAEGGLRERLTEMSARAPELPLDGFARVASEVAEDYFLSSMSTRRSSR